MPTLNCPKCDHDLSGMTGSQCPECGYKISPGPVEAHQSPQAEVPLASYPPLTTLILVALSPAMVFGLTYAAFREFIPKERVGGLVLLVALIVVVTSFIVGRRTARVMVQRPHRSMPSLGSTGLTILLFVIILATQVILSAVLIFTGCIAGLSAQ